MTCWTNGPRQNDEFIEALAVVFELKHFGMETFQRQKNGEG